MNRRATHDLPHRRAGVTLIEVTAALLFIAVVGVLATQVMRSGLGTIRRLQRSEAAQREYDAMIAALRADTWNAFAVAVGDERTLVLRHAAARSTVWIIDDRAEAIERRAVDGEQTLDTRRWRFPGTAAAFYDVGGLVELRLTGGVIGHDAQHRLDSELQRIGALP